MGFWKDFGVKNGLFVVLYFILFYVWVWFSIIKRIKVE